MRIGAADMDVDPPPHKIFVNIWEYRPWPWFFDKSLLYYVL